MSAFRDRPRGQLASIIFAMAATAGAFAQGLAPLPEFRPDAPPSLNFGSTPATPCGTCNMAIEKAMRDLQSRYHALTGSYADFDNAKCGPDDPDDSKATPPFPPDGFFGDDLCNTERAAALVRGLAQHALDSGMWTKFLDADNALGHEGPPQPSALNDYDGTTPPLYMRPWDIDATNYCKVFKQMFEALKHLNVVQDKDIGGLEPTSLGPPLGVYGIWDGTFSCHCSYQWRDASVLFALNKPTPPNVLGGLNEAGFHSLGDASKTFLKVVRGEGPCPEGACRIQPWDGSPAWHGAEAMTGGGVLQGGGSSQASRNSPARGEATTYVRLSSRLTRETTPYDGPTGMNLQDPGNGQWSYPGNNPAPTNERYSAYGHASYPASFRRDLGTTQTDLPRSAGDSQINLGWNLDTSQPDGFPAILTLVQPRFERYPDTVAASMGGCKSCGFGELRTATPGVQLAIGLGASDETTNGYLLLRGDTIVGWGDELIQRNSSGQIVHGTGALELLRQSNVLVRTAGALKRGRFGIVNIDSQNTHTTTVDTTAGKVVVTEGPSELKSAPNVQPAVYGPKYLLVEITKQQRKWVGGLQPFGPSEKRWLKIAMSSELSTNPADNDPRARLVTGTLRIEEYTQLPTNWDTPTNSPEHVTEFVETVAVRDWHAKVDDPNNGTPAIDPNAQEVCEGHLPSNQQWISQVSAWELRNRRDPAANQYPRKVVTEAVVPGANPPKITSKSEYFEADGTLSGRVVETYDGSRRGGALAQRDVSTSQSQVWTLTPPSSPDGYLSGYTRPDGISVGKTVFTVQDELGPNPVEGARAGQLRSFSIASPGQLTRSTEYKYFRFDLDQPLNTGGASTPEDVVEEVDSVDGHEVARRYTVVWDGGPASGRNDQTRVSCRYTGAPTDRQAFLVSLFQAPLGASNASVVHTKRDTTVASSSYSRHDRVMWSVSSDGTGTVYDYTESDLGNALVDPVNSSSIAGQYPGEPLDLDEGVTIRTTRTGPLAASTSSWFSPSFTPQLRDGTRSIEATNARGQTLVQRSWDMAGRPDDPTYHVETTRMVVTRHDDPAGRALRTYSLDGTYTERSYACCGIDQETDAEGMTTKYFYDAFGRAYEVVHGLGTPAELHTAYTFDRWGRTLTASRFAPGQQPSLVSQSFYDWTGRLLSTIDALGHTTSYSETVNATTGTVTRATTSPDPLDGNGPLTSVSITSANGTLLETNTNGQARVLRSSGVELDPTNAGPSEAQAWREYSQETKVGDSGATTEWVRTYSDPLGRQYRTLFADGAQSRTYFDSAGRISKTIDPNDVWTLYAYGYGSADRPAGTNASGWEGQWTLTATDLTHANTIQLGSTQPISRSSRLAIAGCTDHGGNIPVIRSWSTVWTTDGDPNAVVISSTSDSSPDNLRSWSTSGAFSDGNPVSRTETTHIRSQCLTAVTNYIVDGRRSVSTTQYGRELKEQLFAAGASNTLLTESVKSYDALGRLSAVTDTRGTSATSDDRTTSFEYDNADRQYRITTSPPQTGASPQITVLDYDNANRVRATTLPDGAVRRTTFYPWGATKRVWGARQYPAEYTYDAQGRVKTLTTWQQFDQASGQGTGGAATTTWNYSPTRGWLTQKTYHAQTVGPSYQYYPDGKLNKRTWTFPRSTTTTYGYDTGGRPSGVTYSDGNTPAVSFAYDRRGRVKTVTDGAGSRTFTYNNQDQPLSEAFSGTLFNGISIDQHYDSLYRRDSLSASKNSVVFDTTGYSYGSADARLLGLTNGGMSATYAYVPGSSLVQSLAHKNGANTIGTLTRQYDNLDRLTSISYSAANPDNDSRTYAINSANQRTRVDNADGTYWLYQYDDLGQVKSGKRFFTSNNGPVPGQQFEYTFDSIGNRTQAKAGGDAQGQNLRAVSYTPNLLNQYTQRQVSSGVDVMGYTTAGAVTVTNNTVPVAASMFPMVNALNYYWTLLNFPNTTTARYEQITVQPAGQAASDQWVFLPKSPELFTYDSDGNLLTDGRWSYTWDGENRLATMTSTPSMLATQRIVFRYDYLGRRIAKELYEPQNEQGQGEGAMIEQNPGAGAIQQQDEDRPPLGEINPDPGGVTGSGGSIPINPGVVWNLVDRTKYIYDGWNLIAELDDLNRPRRTYAWGIGNSGSASDPGGVGACVFLAPWTLTGATAVRGATLFGVYDGNGNATSWRSAETGAVQAAFDYGPFGESLNVRGIMASSVPIRFSTQYTDSETGLLYFGFRYLNPGIGKWISRDPSAESIGGKDLYAFISNDGINTYDILGLKPPPREYPLDANVNAFDRGTIDDLKGCCPYMLTTRVDVRQFDYSSGVNFAKSMNNAVEPPGNPGRTVGHTWIVLTSEADGSWGGGHSGENGHRYNNPRLAIAPGELLGYSSGLEYLSALPATSRPPVPGVPQADPANPLRWLTYIYEDGEWVPPFSPYHPVSREITWCLTEDEYKATKSLVDRLTANNASELQHYGLTGWQCTSTASRIMNRAGIYLNPYVDLSFPRSLGAFGTTFRLWSDAKYSNIRFALPDKMKQQIEAYSGGRQFSRR